MALGGRFTEICAWRLVLIPCIAVPLCGEPAAAGELPKRPFAKPAFAPPMVRTGRCDAPEAGVERAITLRFSTLPLGLATFPCEFAAPKLLICVGVALILLVTCAFRSEASLRCIAPRLIACPFTNALREVAVTACTLRAYA